MPDDDMLEMNDDLDEEELGLDDDETDEDDDVGPIVVDDEEMI